MLERISRHAAAFDGYTELRLHNNYVASIEMQNGNLTKNETNTTGGISARCYRYGVYSFASAPDDSDDAIRQVITEAQSNVGLFRDQPQRAQKSLPSTPPGTGVYDYRTRKPRFSASERVDVVRSLNDYLTQTHPDLLSVGLQMKSLALEKALVTSEGASTYSYAPHSHFIVTMAVQADDGLVNISDFVGGFGDMEDQFADLESFYEPMEELYRDLRAKAQGVYPEAGYHDVVLGSALAGILAHEAIGHPCEGDAVLAGSVAGQNLGKQVASEKVTLMDCAGRGPDGQGGIAIHVDDEGTPCHDVTIIEKGVLKEFLTNKETARELGMIPSGNARAYAFSDEPLVRMRNTIIAPGTDKFEDMIAAVDNGYFIKRRGITGQADKTSEFMFSVNCGYEIKNGELGRAIRDTTISGMAFDVLKSVTHVGDEMSWGAGGMCGKKQVMPVGGGGPAVKCKINIGGH
ncbi:MAG: TldD/PmbA family protein [Deltaproteobacteria bacterium]|nr:TldD/PmbA family protein [Deltaproteobacteria bacterium]